MTAKPNGFVKASLFPYSQQSSRYDAKAKTCSHTQVEFHDDRPACVMK